MTLASQIRRLIQGMLRQTPSADEARVFTALAAEARSIGTLLARSPFITLGAGAGVNLADGDEREILAATLRAGVAQHLRSGEDLLALVERLDRMAEAARGRRDATQRTELGIALLRAIAIVELLAMESCERFPAFEPLEALAADARGALAPGYLRTLGADLPADMRRAFPRFVQAVREAALKDAALVRAPARTSAAEPGARATTLPPRGERMNAPSMP